MAGAGMYSGNMIGTLDAYFSPFLPHRVGTIAPDPAGSFRANPQCPLTCASAMTIMYVPTTTAQTTIRDRHAHAVVGAQGAMQQAGCPEDDRVCAASRRAMQVLIMNPSGAYDIFTITNVQDDAMHLQHRDDKFTTAYPAGLVDHADRVAHLLSRRQRHRHLPPAALRRLQDRPADRRQRGRLPRRVLRRPIAAASWSNRRPIRKARGRPTARGRQGLGRQRRRPVADQ